MGCKNLLGQPTATRETALDHEVEYFLRQFDMALADPDRYFFHPYGYSGSHNELYAAPSSSGAQEVNKIFPERIDS